MTKLNAAETIEILKRKKALVHHITNWVTINDCAQITRHWGCLPVMAHAREEVAEMVGLAGALVLNIGTLEVGLVDAMIEAALAANKKGIPIALDAVGVGATKLRTEQAHRILKSAKISVLKGNAGEIATLAGIEAEVRGVEAISVGGDMSEAAKALAKKLGLIVAVTGEVDIATDGEDVLSLAYGHPLMGRVVGTGCISTSTVGCFLTAGDDRLRLTAEALAAFGYAGEEAAKKAEGPGDFLPKLYNAIVQLSARPAKLALKAK